MSATSSSPRASTPSSPGGRAGGGSTTIGYAVVLWSPFVPFEQVAALAASRAFRLASAFRPTYNMAANLVRRYDPDTAHHLLNLSFAQFQADGRGALERRLDERGAGRARGSRACDRGDVDEYLALVEQRRARGRPAARGVIDGS